MKRAILIGTFDLTHYGHYEKCRMLKDNGFCVVVAVTRDRFCEEYKRRPIMSMEERMRNMSSCKWVDEVIIDTGGHDVRDMLIENKIDVLAHGSDWSSKDYMKQVGITRDWMDENNIDELILPYTRTISTSELIKNIKERNDLDE